MITRFSAAVCVIALFFVSSPRGQYVQDPFDQGQADTLKMVFTVLPNAATSQLNVSLDVYVFNDVQSLGSLEDIRAFDMNREIAESEKLDRAISSALKAAGGASTNNPTVAPDKSGK